MPLNNSHAIFSPKLDRIYFAIHGIFLILTILMALGLLPSVGWDQVTVRFVVSIFFFNGLHTVLTWFGLFALPEGRHWIKRQWQSRNSKNGLRIWLVISIIFGLGWYFLETRFLKNLPPESTLTFSLVLFVLAAFHNIGQTKGLALMQTQKLGTRDKVASWERYLYNALVLVIVFGSIRLMANPFFGQKIPIWWDLSALVLGGLLTIALIVIAFRLEKSFRSKKFWFASTTVYHPLLLLSPAAFVFQRALHGTEYLFLSISMARKSKMRWNSRLGLLLVTLLILTALTKIKLYKTLTGFELLPRDLIHGFAIMGLWIEYTHYYLDSILFRFQDPIVRETIGPLIKEESTREL